MYTEDPVNSATDRLRLITGDTDNDDIGLEDAVLEYLIAKYPDNEVKAAIEALSYLVSKYAACATEKVGGIFYKGSDKYNQYKNLHDRLTKDPRSAIIKFRGGYTGGISKSEMANTQGNSDANGSPIKMGAFDKDVRSSTWQRRV